MEILLVIDNSGKYYKLCVVKLPDVATPVYGIIHKEYDVVEMSTSILANAKSMLKRFENWEEHPEDSDTVMPDLAPGMLS